MIAGTVLIGAEAARVWRLGKLPLSRTDSTPLTGAPRRIRLREVPSVLRVGYCVSSTREATIFNMLASFVVTFGLTRGITITIKRRGRLGPIRDLSAGGRHIHHFVPGAIISLIVGGTAVGQGRSALDRYLAIPFGIGIALFLDEAALLLELEDVYWTEKGALSLQVISATTLALAAIAHAEAQRRRREPGLEADWLAAAAAFDSLRALGRTRRPSSRPTG